MVDCSWIWDIKFFYVKCHYFLYNGALACVIPYLPVHAREIGISVVSVGVIYSFLPLLTMVAKPFFGAIADCFNNLKMLLVICMGIIMLSSSLTFAIPRKRNVINSKVHCSQAGTNLYFNTKPSQDCMVDVLMQRPLKCYMYCTECLSFKHIPVKKKSVKICEKEVVHPTEIMVKLEKRNGSQHTFSVKNMLLNDRDMNVLCFANLTFNCSSVCEPVLQECFTGKEEPEYHSDQFWLFLIFTSMCVSLSGVANSFSDAICFNELGEDAHLYGRQRLWGTIGWGLLSPVAGYVNELFTGDSFLKAYQPGAIIQIIVMVYDFFIVKRLRTKNLKFSQDVCKDVRTVLGQFKVIAFMCSVLVVGSFTALLWSFLFWHLTNLGANKIVLGVVPAVQCFLGELPYFFFSGKIISILGHFNVLTLNFVMFGIRFIAYSYIDHPWVVLPIELLQGPTYGLFYATMASFANVAALPGTEVTMQGLVGSAFELGMVIGNLLGGIGMHKRDGHYVFFYGGVVSLVYCTVNIAFTLISRFLDKKQVIAQEEVESPEENESYM